MGPLRREFVRANPFLPEWGDRVTMNSGRERDRRGVVFRGKT